MATPTPASTAPADAPSLDTLVARAEEDLLPLLRARAAETEALRRVPDETIATFREAGLFRLYQPARYGGYEMDPALTPIALCGVLGRACAASTWVMGVVSSHAWLVGLYPRAAQYAVWGADAERRDALVASALSPADGHARAVEGGYLLEGTWNFSSGVDAVDWVVLNAPVREGGKPGEFRMCLVPRADFEIVDTWFAAGLQGTGSKDVYVKSAFVPTDLAVDLADLDGGTHPGPVANPQAWIYTLPLRPVFAYSTVAVALGVANGVLDVFTAEHRARPERAALVPRQLRLAESAAEVHSAEALLRRDAAEIRARALAGMAQTVEERMRYRLHIAYAAQLCVRAVDRLVAVQGAHGIQAAHPNQRALRDIHAIASHGGLAWDVAATSYGRLAFGG